MWKQSMREVRQIAKHHRVCVKAWFTPKSFYPKQIFFVCLFFSLLQNLLGMLKTAETVSHGQWLSVQNTYFSFVFNALKMYLLEKKKIRCRVACEISFSLLSKLLKKTKCDLIARVTESVRNVMGIISSRDFKWSNILAIFEAISTAALSALLWKHACATT